MSEQDLKHVRPNARFDNSTRAYHEAIDTCQPFLTSATYVFSRWRGLRQVRLSREWTVSDPAELESLLPGFLYGCRSLWGTPAGIEVFERPRWKGLAWNVWMWWHLSWGDVYAFYSSPKALFPSGQKWLAALDVTFSLDGIAAFRAWSKGDTEVETIGRYFHGFPTEADAPLVILH